MTTPLPSSAPSHWPYENVIRYKIKSGQRYAFVKWVPMYVTMTTWNANKDDPNWWLVNYTWYIKELEQTRGKMIIHSKNSWIQVSNSD